MNDKFQLIIDEVNRLIPDEAKDECEVVVEEIVKSNDTKLHGLMIKYPNRNVFPTLYLEELAELLDEGVDLEEIAVHVLATSLLQGPSIELENYDFSFENIKDKLRAFVLSRDLNVSRISNMLHAKLSCEFEMVAYVVEEESAEDRYRFPVTKKLSDEFGYDEDLILSTALENTMKQHEPCIGGFLELCNYGPTEAFKRKDFMNRDVTLNDKEWLFVVSNAKADNGAISFFYPNVMNRVADIFDDSFYVIPSSVHEVMVVPRSACDDVEELQQKLRNCNAEMPPQEVLSDRVYFFNRKSGKLSTALHNYLS